MVQVIYVSFLNKVLIFFNVHYLNKHMEEQSKPFTSSCGYGIKYLWVYNEWRWRICGVYFLTYPTEWLQQNVTFWVNFIL